MVSSMSMTSEIHTHKENFAGDSRGPSSLSAKYHMSIREDRISEKHYSRNGQDRKSPVTRSDNLVIESKDVNRVLEAMKKQIDLMEVSEFSATISILFV